MDADDSKWTDLSVVKNNSENEVLLEIPMENLVSAQVYRFVVDESGQPGAQTWGALRIYEMELFAFDGTLENVGNGKIKASDEGVFDVSYQVNKNEINSTKAVISDTAAAFTDIDKMSWANDSIWLTTGLGLFKGVDKTSFAPASTMTRGMIVTVLHRMAGAPEAESKIAFSDVASNRYFTKAVAWATENGITKGYPDGTFCPDAPVTRQEMVTFLYRFAKLNGAEAVDGDYIGSFADAANVKPFAKEAMNWAVANGIIIGDKNNGQILLNPRGTANRAQLAVIFARYVDLI